MNVFTILFTLFTLSMALPAVHVTGKKFFTSDGNQFYVIGVDYQPSSDPLADTAGLNRDIPYLTALGINAIRVYSVDITQNHDAGMQLLESAGIYVLLDATEPAHSIDANAPSWTTDIFTGIQQKIQIFAKYTNMLGFLAGNEVILTNEQTNAASYIKAAVRDVKAYLKTLGSTALVGYAATDVSANDNLQPFLDCQSEDTSVDFYGINTYRWCNGDTFQTSGYAMFVSGTYDRPVIFTEFGCNRVQPRVFDEIQAIYGSQMTGSLSGGFVYEWSQEANSYGLVNIDSPTKLTTYGDYDNLKSQLAKINPTRITESSYTAPASQVVTCPAKTSTFEAQAFPLPPTPDVDKCKCMASSLTCTADPTATVAKIQSAVSTACNSVSCAGITSAWDTASYGEYSMCSALQRASYALNTYYSAYSKSQGADACDFGGVGKLVTPSDCAGDATVIVSQSVVETQTQTKAVSSVVIQTSVGTDGITKSQSAIVTNVVVDTTPITVSKSVASTSILNRYQTAWDAAFQASPSMKTLPTLGLLVSALLFLTAF